MKKKVLIVAAVLAQSLAIQAQAVTDGAEMSAPQVKNDAQGKSEVQMRGEAVLSSQEKHRNGDWYLGLGVGISHCMAENATADDFIGGQAPSYNVMVGHNFGSTFGLRLTGAMNFQSSRCNEALSTSLKEVYGDGRYKFKCWSAQLSAVLNMTNLFFGYNQSRFMTWNMVLGGGAVGVFDFEKKVIDRWNLLTYYPVNGDGGVYGVGHLGMECCVRVAKAWDVGLIGRVNVTDNNYNGVSNNNTIDFYLDAMLSAVYHLKNGKQGMRRLEVPGRKVYVDPVLADCAVAKPEVVVAGERMNAVVPFYAGFYYLNDATMMRVEQVAKFMRLHPEVALVVEGHPDVVPDGDEIYHEHLAMKRAETVKKALVEDFGIEEGRLECVAVDKALQTFKTVREWVPAVSFLMKEK